MISWTKRRTFEDRIAAVLAACDRDIASLQARASGAPPLSRSQQVHNIQNLLERREVGRTRLQQMRQADDETWERLREHVEQGIDELRFFIARARSDNPN